MTKFILSYYVIENLIVIFKYVIMLLKIQL